ncbi:hypothetical protein HY496_02695 [Candidatus Woesearchaeota archaeon]|nr:hypothetical protein [Candidatus Woesearchaeota archaeon]
MPPHQFPEESVQKVKELADLSSHQKQMPLILEAESIFRTFSKSGMYGFQDQLRTGLYAPWPHEMYQNNVYSFNCTSIIPQIYLWAEVLHLQPQIVQFCDFTQYRDGSDDVESNNSHFALIIDVKKKHPYLLDPFWDICNPIRERTPQRMVLGAKGDRKRVVREYSSLLEYSPEEFAAMYHRLHEPAESLEMLACGQKVEKYIPTTKETTSSTLMAFYDSPQTIRTRLKIPQPGITDKFIGCELTYTPQGEIGRTSLELCLGQNTTWTDIVGKTVVARGSFSEFEAIRSVAKHLALYSPQRKTSAVRLGPLLHENQSAAKDLCAITTQLYHRLQEDEKESLQQRLLVRTLYEQTEPAQEYLTTEKERFARIEELRLKGLSLRDRTEELERELWRHGWKLESLEQPVLRRLRREQSKLSLETEKIDHDLRDLLRLHFRNKRAYHRRMDMVGFAEQWKGAPLENIEETVRRQGCDPAVGYAAMVVDFIPFLFSARKEIELRRYRASIGEKIKAWFEREM